MNLKLVGNTKFNTYIISTTMQPVQPGQSGQTRTLDSKIKECRQLYIQNVEKTLQQSMIFKYFRDQKIQPLIKNFKLNPSDCYITVEFHDHEKALEFYDRANFKEKILVRPLNIYFNLQLNEAEMKKYYFDGIDENNIRRLFEIARKIGICKIYTNYSSSNKIKTNGILSFIRQEEIPEATFNQLKDDLKAIGIKIEPYLTEKGLRCSIQVTNFYTGDKNADEEAISKPAKEQIEKKFTEIFGNVDGLKITPIIKKKQVPDADSQKGSRTQTKIRAIVEFETSETTLKNFEQVRKAYIKQQTARATLNFHNAEINSYVSLFTIGLMKPEDKKDMTDRQFEDQLTECFRKVNKNVVQVTVYPLKFNNTYVGRVYLSDELSGKTFIAEYPTKREFLVNYFKSPTFVFDMNIDIKTSKKIKVMQNKVNLIARGIKNANDMQKKNIKGKPINNQPIDMRAFQQGGIPNMGMSNQMGMMMGPMNPQMNHQMNPQMNQGMNHGMNPGMNPGMNQGGPRMNPSSIQGAPQMGNPDPIKDIRMKISKIIQDKDRLINDGSKNERTVKQSLVLPIRHVLEQEMKIPNQQLGAQTDLLIRKGTIKQLVEFLQEPQKNYDAIFKNQN